MKMSMIIWCLIVFAKTVSAQNTWKTSTKFDDIENFNSPVTWIHNGKVWVWSNDREYYRKGNVDFLSAFHGSSSQIPENRRDAMQWTTESELWLFGGISVEKNIPLNDLWVYDLNTDSWEVIKANEKFPTIYKGAATWSTQDRLWMFGGVKENSKNNPLGLSDELWFFDLKSKQWHLRDTEKKPTGRTDMAVWSTASGEILLYGGFGYSEDGKWSGGLSDLWVFNSKAEKWENDDRQDIPYKRRFGSHKNLPHPGYRVKPSYWMDKEGYCWLMFGQSTITNNQVTVDTYIWRLDPREKKWKYTPLEQDRFAISASGVVQDDKGQTYMLFPTFINEKAMRYDNPSIHQLTVVK